MLSEIKKYLDNIKDGDYVKQQSYFFKTNKNDYASKEIFLGIKNKPLQDYSKLIYKSTSLQDIKQLLNSKIHEEKLIACYILVLKYQKQENKKEIVNFYIKNTKLFSNWNLVDSTAHKILGDYLINEKKDILYNLAKSTNMWERRISVVANLSLIKNNQLFYIQEICKILLNDKQDLIHKACGWLLRELGKKDTLLLLNFINSNYEKLNRTTLRYSIEKLKPQMRKDILKGNIVKYM